MMIPRRTQVQTRFNSLARFAARLCARGDEDIYLNSSVKEGSVSYRKSRQVMRI